VPPAKKKRTSGGFDAMAALRNQMKKNQPMRPANIRAGER
tara:strand:- start:181 stop:300 length:120 start_codon:yes stop_codon:yes gene_type:complete